MNCIEKWRFIVAIRGMSSECSCRARNSHRQRFVLQNDWICIQMMSLIFNMMNFVAELAAAEADLFSLEEPICIEIDEFCSQTDGFCIRMMNWIQTSSNRSRQRSRQRWRQRSRHRSRQRSRQSQSAWAPCGFTENWRFLNGKRRFFNVSSVENDGSSIETWWFCRITS